MACLFTIAFCSGTQESEAKDISHATPLKSQPISDEQDHIAHADSVESANFLKGAVAAWDLSGGFRPEGTSLNVTVKSALSGGADATEHWAISLNDPIFGRVLDFSTEGSYLRAPGSRVTLGAEFSISAWIKAPIGNSEVRVIAAQGTPTDGWELEISRSQTLIFQSGSLEGETDSNHTLVDGKWHHVLVARDGNILTYYVDKRRVRSRRVGTTPIRTDADIYIGNATDLRHSFDGSLARVRIYATPKTPDEVTSIRVPTSDGLRAKPALSLRRGIAFDRRQYASFLPPENETVYPQDIVNCRNMGFDHVKVLFTPNHLINSDGSLRTERLSYMKLVVDRVIAAGMPCLICIHPEVPFKQTYLVESVDFEKLIRWYTELAVYIGQHWTARQVAIQLMTEPYANTPENRWTWMSDRMYGAVRNVLPDHTIVTSADGSGNIEHLKLMRPATDSNLIYSFTTYEPYTAGFNIARTALGTPATFWKLLRDIPYPANPTVLNAERIEKIIQDVPQQADRDAARIALTDYADGTDDGGKSWPNAYGIVYNATWHRTRAKSLSEWSQRYGGVHLMCVEFGAMDSDTARKYFTGGTGNGLSAAGRIQFIGDLRRSFEAYDIGWTYWSYNDPFTVFLPSKRVMGASPDAAVTGPSWFDYDLLETGLGLSPLIPRH